jgi:hypothetical protein
MARAAAPQGPQETAVKWSTATRLCWSADENAADSRMEINTMKVDPGLLGISWQVKLETSLRLCGKTFPQQS